MVYWYRGNQADEVAPAGEAELAGDKEERNDAGGFSCAQRIQR